MFDRTLATEISGAFKDEAAAAKTLSSLMRLAVEPLHKRLIADGGKEMESETLSHAIAALWNAATVYGPEGMSADKKVASKARNKWAANYRRRVVAALESVILIPASDEAPAMTVSARVSVKASKFDATRAEITVYVSGIRKAKKNRGVLDRLGSLVDGMGALFAFINPEEGEKIALPDGVAAQLLAALELLKQAGTTIESADAEGDADEAESGE